MNRDSHLRTLTRSQVRELDRRAIEEFGIPGIVLMENAGRGVADLLCQLGISGRVVICCGKGNNAGDGLVIARHLQLRGYAVDVWTWSDPGTWSGDAAINVSICQSAGIALTEASEDWPSVFAKALQSAGWVVDALLGTGATGAPRDPLGRVIQMMNASPAKKMAVDVPSGLDCDTGIAEGDVFRAGHTCTFVAPKPGMILPEAKSATGELHVADIGAPRVLVDEMLGA